MKYKVVAPHGEISIGLPYGTVTFKHGEIVDNSFAVQQFPEYFIPVVDFDALVAQAAKNQSTTEINVPINIPVEPPTSENEDVVSDVVIPALPVEKDIPVPQKEEGFINNIKKDLKNKFKSRKG